MDKKISFLINLMLLVFIMIPLSCTQSEGQTNTATSVDQPYLSSSEAIGLAKEDALEHTDWAIRPSLAALYVKGEGWNAKYIGNDKWKIDLRLSSQDGASVTIYRWSVFESSLSAVYVGQYIEKKPDIASQLSEEQVIKSVKELGVPECSSSGSAIPFGEWAATLGDDSIWIVVGNVEIHEGALVYQAQTVWEHNGYTIILVQYNLLD